MALAEDREARPLRPHPQVLSEGHTGADNPGPGEHSPAHRRAHTGLRHTGQPSHSALYMSPKHTHTQIQYHLRGKACLQNRVGVLEPERPKYGCSPHLP